MTGCRSPTRTCTSGHLAIEEQFYFVWPAVLVFLALRHPERLRTILWCLLGAAVGLQLAAHQFWLARLFSALGAHRRDRHRLSSCRTMRPRRTRLDESLSEKHHGGRGRDPDDWRRVPMG